MKTPDEIKKGLECCAASSEDCTMNTACPYHGGESGMLCMTVMSADALAYIQQLEAKVPKWIGVEERLPSGFDYFDDGTAEPAEYIVKVKNAEVATIAMFDGKEWIPAQYNGITEDRWFASSVTHWMPLPEPPEEEV